MRQQHGAGAGADALEALDDFVLAAQAVIGVDVLADELVQFVDLLLQGPEALLEALADVGMTGHAAGGWTPGSAGRVSWRRRVTSSARSTASGEPPGAAWAGRWRRSWARTWASRRSVLASWPMPRAKSRTWRGIGDDDLVAGAEQIGRRATARSRRWPPGRSRRPGGPGERPGAVAAPGGRWEGTSFNPRDQRRRRRNPWRHRCPRTEGPSWRSPCLADASSTGVWFAVGSGGCPGYSHRGGEDHALPRPRGPRDTRSLAARSGLVGSLRSPPRPDRFLWEHSP